MEKKLILPITALQSHVPLPRQAKALTFSEATGTASTFADLVHILVTLRPSEVVRWVSPLIELLSRNENMTVAIQSNLIHNFLDADLARKVIAKLKERPRDEGFCAVFHRRQLWLVLQLATIASSESTPPLNEMSVRYAIGRACLMASDCLAKFEGVQALDSDNPKGDLGWLITVMLSHTDIALGIEAFARAHSLWFDSFSDPLVKKKFDSLAIGPDFNALFAQKYGLTLHEFLYIAESLYASFAAPTMKLKIEAAMIDTSQDSEGIFSEEDKRRVLDAMSFRIGEMPTRLLGTPRQSWATDFSPLHARPLIEVFPAKYACPDLSFYRQFLVDGIYWMLDKAIGKRWKSFYGDLYNWYINQVISCFCPQSDVLANRFYPNKKFQGTEDEVCDGLILLEDTAVFCEYKGTRLTTYARAGVEIEKTIKAVEGMLGADDCGAGQLAENISLALEGKIIPAGHDVIDLRHQYKRIIPILICQEEGLVNHATRLHLQQLFTDFLTQRKTNDSRIGPLLLFSTRDVEVLEEFSHHERVDTLLCSFADFVRDNPRHVGGIFHVFVRENYKSQPCPDGFVNSKVRQILDSVIAEHNKRHPTGQCSD